MFSSIGLIGAGTMGSAVLQAAAKGAPGAALYCSNRTPAKAQALAQEVNGLDGEYFRVRAEALVPAAGSAPEKPVQN